MLFCGAFMLAYGHNGWIAQCVFSASAYSTHSSRRKIKSRESPWKAPKTVHTTALQEIFPVPDLVPARALLGKCKLS